MSAAAEYAAGCHCGALIARYWTGIPVSRWTPRGCACRYCQAQGALYVSDPEGRLQFIEVHAGALVPYLFGTHTAQFLSCHTCGIYLGARAIAGDVGILNVRTLQPWIELPAAAMVDHGAEDAVRRVERRRARWTPLAASGASLQPAGGTR